jgi:hypothetical protein
MGPSATLAKPAGFTWRQRGVVQTKNARDSELTQAFRD